MAVIRTSAATRFTTTTSTPLLQLHDYVGEPGNWPHVSSSFGSFDVGGIPKAASFWLRSWWLSNVSTSDAGRPPLDPATTTTTVRLVESWAPAGGGGNTRKLNAYSNAPFVQLYVNGAAQGGRVAMGPFSHVTWNAINYAPGNVTVAALSASGAVLATHTRKSWGAAVALRLSCDAPSDSTGTGSAVYLDGTDVALLRATVVDAAGNTVADSSANITFTVTAPGLVLGSVNGDRECRPQSSQTTRMPHTRYSQTYVPHATRSCSCKSRPQSGTVEAGLPRRCPWHRPRQCRRGPTRCNACTACERQPRCGWQPLLRDDPSGWLNAADVDDGDRHIPRPDHCDVCRRALRRTGG